MRDSPAGTRPGRLPVERSSAVLLAVLVVAAGAYLAGGYPVRLGLVVGADALGAVAIVAGVRRFRPERPAPWLLIAAAQICGAVADAVNYLASGYGSPWPFPGPPDLFYLGRYPLMFVAVLLWARRASAGRASLGRGADVAVIDVGIVVVAAAMLSWIFVISPLTGGTTGLDALIVVTAYPVGDLVLVAVGVRMYFGGGQASPALGLLGGYLGLWLFADTLFDLTTLNGTYRPLRLLELVWVGAAILVSAAALHPSMRTVGTPSPDRLQEGSARRLLLLGGVSLLAPAAEFAQYVRGEPLHVPLVTGVCATLFVLVTLRMNVLLTAQRRLAITDALTGLRTRRFFEAALALEYGRAVRNDSTIGVLLADVDHFKDVNDRYGHKAGDLVLREVAARLAACTRSGDVVARYGGEEFAVLVPNTDRGMASALAERLRRAVAGTAFPVGDGVAVPVTASIGVALLPAHARTPDELTVRADQCLYRAKNDGRNRVVVADDLARFQPDQSPLPGAL
ncbi:sensor domain-containing diguanylate cyclase [Cryptosporangium phraense]|uniref:GGDEF domain-containing protein n=1 Tax=Cryptosporangium phraense TaxID=2593070 RepID=A0A545AXB2_9ACTN|nr:GGDEF domain-containing protein [Cryptosporangium phraense]TQS45977.1 GGDEF domain-containing protein [Cryptosporangium phraense]